MISGYQRLGRGPKGTEDSSGSKTALYQSVMVAICHHMFVQIHTVDTTGEH